LKKPGNKRWTLNLPRGSHRGCGQAEDRLCDRLHPSAYMKLKVIYIRMSSPWWLVSKVPDSMVLSEYGWDPHCWCLWVLARHGGLPGGVECLPPGEPLAPYVSSASGVNSNWNQIISQGSFYLFNVVWTRNKTPTLLGNAEGHEDIELSTKHCVAQWVSTTSSPYMADTAPLKPCLPSVPSLQPETPFCSLYLERDFCLHSAL
jgi:hypothetical protein